MSGYRKRQQVSLLAGKSNLVGYLRLDLVTLSGRVLDSI